MVFALKNNNLALNHRADLEGSTPSEIAK